MRKHITQESLQRAKTAFFQEGKSIADWARENHFRQDLVYAVLGGRTKCNRGESHRIAVALGLKPVAGEQAEEESTKQ